MKKMSISGDLGTGALLAGKVSNQFSTNESSRQLDDQEVANGQPSVTRKQSEGDLNLNERIDWLVREDTGKRKNKHTARWLKYQSSQQEEKRSRSRLIRKSNAVNDLLYSPRNFEVVREQMLQVDDLFKMVTGAYRVQYFVTRRQRWTLVRWSWHQHAAVQAKDPWLDESCWGGKEFQWKQSQKGEVHLEVCYQ